MDAANAIEVLRAFEREGVRDTVRLQDKADAQRLRLHFELED